MKYFSILSWMAILLLTGCTSLLSDSPTAIPPPPTALPSPRAMPQSIYLRLNQVGYLPQESKVALALTDVDLSGDTFQVTLGSEVVFTGPVGQDRGAYGQFAHLYELDFSQVAEPGAYSLSIMETAAPVNISAEAYAALIPLTLQFFRVQRCGDTEPLGHEVCHVEDGVAVGGPMDGQPVEATGGWHDAGDYIKFLITTGYVTNLMLTTYQRHPDVFADPKDPQAIPGVLAEVRIGLDWMLKLWDPEHDILYYQVSDESDHENWRLPEKDTMARPVWACEPGKGANVAGKAAAALALASSIWNDEQRPYYDAELASAYLTAAKEIYAFGQKRPEAQPSNPSDFYREESWQDDMALAAAELYRATGEKAYLKQARDYAEAAGEFEGLDWANMHALAHYEIARLEPTYVSTAQALLAANLKKMQENANTQPFQVGIAEFHWGSNETMANIALTALWYEDLAGDATYRPLAQAQRDFILGSNPWGVCWVSGAGVNWPKYPHHQIADLGGMELTGFWDEGAAPLEVFEAYGPAALRSADIYADFQTEAAVYHDDTEDWVTNEPTITMNATGLALTAWYTAAR